MTRPTTPTTGPKRIIPTMSDGAARRHLATILVGCLFGCGAPPAREPPTAAESWSVTAWGGGYEVFPEVPALIAGETAVAHTHVTRLGSFAPLTRGAVEIVLSGPSGERVYRADGPLRPGIFAVELRPEEAADFDLSFRIIAPEGGGEVRGGRVRVGTAQEPGRLLVAPAPKGAEGGGEALSFLKEQQWRSGFGTAWVRLGRLGRSVSGFARVRPPAGGESVVSSPVDGVLQPPSGSPGWPFVGRAVEPGDVLFRVVPSLAPDRSLSLLSAERSALSAQLRAARSRLGRLEELLAFEATSRREVEEARAQVGALEAREAAAARDLEGARSSRQGGSSGGIALRSPLAGVVAQISASPGTRVSAGDRLARLVRTDLRWLEVSLAPEDVAQLAGSEAAAVILGDGEGPPVRIEEGLRRISVAPELSTETGTVKVLLEVPANPRLILGTTLEAQIVLAAFEEGVVIPLSAVVDDGGVPVVYLQLSGESFMRQQVRILQRQGERALVGGLTPGQRLVTRGGEAIRRSSLMATGSAHGHVH